MQTLLTSHFIDGQLVPPVNGRYLDIVNPADESIYGKSAAGTKEDIDAAVAAAKKASDAWGNTTGAERAAIIRKVAEAIEKNKDEISKKEAIIAGKPLQEAAWDVDDVIGCFQFNAELAEKLDKKQGQVVDVGMEEFVTKLYYEPMGVVGLIVPWNYPMLMAAWKVAAALAAGCAIVLKPSELSPYTALDMAFLAHQAGLPKGVLNVVTGMGPDTGAHLSTHPDVEKVAFTGSVATGSKVMHACADGIKNVSLELGGKSPIIVFDDVDIDTAVEWIMFGIFWTNGQICTATSRLLIHEKIAPKVYARLKEVTEKIIPCDPLTPERKDAAFIGPIVSKAQYEKVMSYIEAGKQEGAQVLTGGGRPASAPAKGFWVAPTVFTNVTPDMKIWKEEIFGPVLSCMTFTSEQEALALANDSWAGLGSAVLSGDQSRRERIAKGLKAGIVWVNCSQPCFCQAPWGGVKKSGIGRDNGEEGFNSYLQIKQVTEWVSKDKWGWYIPPGFTRPPAKL
eukprot:CAMPEP_0177714376 /NCGR_PEP_ID=MMETSP0484_2-20121128/13428_1 /TAXON_ID=354590 /ORGANISM="Rhodomonas lens, Strain RHODO" /LENGTH=507 /DNA_ID=CAMNT_0019226305 /DNA_START=23 /DNA_END=1546 /DNA_ORIENTATION=+